MNTSNGPGTPTSTIAYGGGADYAWTHSAAVEAFFALLTIAIVPVALLRWVRRLRFLRAFAHRAQRRDATS
jgi:hypothetical protein